MIKDLDAIKTEVPDASAQQPSTSVGLPDVFSKLLDQKSSKKNPFAAFEKTTTKKHQKRIKSEESLTIPIGSSEATEATSSNENQSLTSKSRDTKLEKAVVDFVEDKKQPEEKYEEQQTKTGNPESKKKRKLQKELDAAILCRVKPDRVLDREKERNFMRLATKGVVQLFNAVREHQANVESAVKESGASERKKEKALKSAAEQSEFFKILDNVKTKTAATTATSRKKVTVEKKSALDWNTAEGVEQAMKSWDSVKKEELDFQLSHPNFR